MFMTERQGGLIWNNCVPPSLNMEQQQVEEAFEVPRLELERINGFNGNWFCNNKVKLSVCFSSFHQRVIIWLFVVAVRVNLFKWLF